MHVARSLADEMSVNKQLQAIADVKQRREALGRQIKELAQERDNYLRAQVEAEGGAKDSLDQKLFDAVREQAASKGMRYHAPAPSY